MKRSALFLALALTLPGLTVKAAETDKPVAKVGDVVLTEKQMNDELAMNLYEAESQVYQMKRSWADQKAKEILFDRAAKEAKQSRQNWENAMIESKTPEPTQDEINGFLHRYPKEAQASTDTLHQITQYIKGQKRQDAETKVFEDLQKKYAYQVFIPKPEAPHISVPFTEKDPFWVPRKRL